MQAVGDTVGKRNPAAVPAGPWLTPNITKLLCKSFCYFRC